MDTIKPWEKPQFTNTIIKIKVKEVDLFLVRPPRAGVILYTKINNQLYFCLGIDAQSHQFTDFGGGISYHKDKNVIEGALREFHEETLNIFNYLNITDFLDCLVLYNTDMLIIFKYINTISNIRSDFLNQVQLHKNVEVSDIIWLNLEEFKNVITTRGRMFSRVQNFLQKAGNFYWLL